MKVSNILGRWGAVSQPYFLLPRYKSQRRYRKKRERESCFKYE